MRDGAEPLEVAGMQDRFATRSGVAERRIVHDDRDRAECAFDRSSEFRVIGVDDHTVVDPGG